MHNSLRKSSWDSVIRTDGFSFFACLCYIRRCGNGPCEYIGWFTADIRKWQGLTPIDSKHSFLRNIGNQESRISRGTFFFHETTELQMITPLSPYTAEIVPLHHFTVKIVWWKKLSNLFVLALIVMLVKTIEETF